MFAMMKVGASKPWKEVIKIMTGEGKMDTAAFREYFAPLEKWLRAENKKNGVKVGWTVDVDKYCKKSDNYNSASVAGSAIAVVLSALSAHLLLHW